MYSPAKLHHQTGEGGTVKYFFGLIPQGYYSFRVYFLQVYEHMEIDYSSFSKYVYSRACDWLTGSDLLTIGELAHSYLDKINKSGIYFPGLVFFQCNRRYAYDGTG